MAELSLVEILIYSFSSHTTRFKETPETAVNQAHFSFAAQAPIGIKLLIREQIMNLKNEIKECLGRLSAEVKQFPWEDKTAYAHWLGQTYYYVCHSTRLLALAASRFEDQKLHNRFLDHLREERGHEKIALLDLKELRVAIHDIPCFPETHAFYMTQYYYLEHADPTSFFGWIFSLEGTAAQEGGSLCSRVKKAHGEQAANFLKVHATEDISHLEKAYDAVKEITPAAWPKLVENLNVSAELYTGFLNRCSSAEKSRRSAA